MAGNRRVKSISTGASSRRSKTTSVACFRARTSVAAFRDHIVSYHIIPALAPSLFSRFTLPSTATATPQNLYNSRPYARTHARSHACTFAMKSRRYGLGPTPLIAHRWDCLLLHLLRSPPARPFARPVKHAIHVYHTYSGCDVT